MTFLLYIIPLFCWVFIAKVLFSHKFSIEEMLIQLSAVIALIALTMFLSSTYLTSDMKMVNGHVTKLDIKKQSCPTNWRDFRDGFCSEYRTRTVPDGQICTTTNNIRTCSTTYKTQYKYIYDWEQRFYVETTIQRYEIKRVDRQGVVVPDRFSEIKIDDPVTGLVKYTNYIKGASDTLLNQKLEEVPPIAYPSVRDYYKVSRVIYYGIPTDYDFVKEWNKTLAKVNSEIAKTGANVIINVTGSSVVWAEGLAQAWDSHNINDVVITIGSDGTNINWVDVRSWSESDLVNVIIRDKISDLKTIDTIAINDIIKQSILDNYKEQPMDNFKYLADDIPTPTWFYIVMALILLVITPGITYAFLQIDVKL